MPSINKTILIYLIGKSGVGKYTVAKALEKHGFILCDNQLINYPIFSLLQYDRKQSIPDYAWEIIAKIRDTIFEFISKEASHNYVLTNVLGDIPRDHKLFIEVQSLAEKRLSLFVPIKMNCDIDENIKRIQDASRKTRYKSMDIQDVYKQKIIQLTHPNLLEIDVTALTPQDVVSFILKHIETISSKFTFKPLSQCDLNLLCQWFSKPHVSEWWQDNLSSEEIKDKYGKRIGDPVVCPFIVYLNDKPIGFIQYYWASKVGDSWWPNEDDYTVGTDQFIGEGQYLNQGYGTLMMKAFVKFLFKNPKINKIITEADPNNIRAKRCYEKAGFQDVDLIKTPDGNSILMVIKRKNNDL
ncbi:TPA: GNAT family N-acetyltransferase [Legionella pneumophila]